MGWEQGSGMRHSTQRQRRQAVAAAAAAAVVRAVKGIVPADCAVEGKRHLSRMCSGHEQQQQQGSSREGSPAAPCLWV